jgi:hypothetical protein
MEIDDSYLLGMTELFEDIRDMILDALPMDEAREYHFCCKRERLFAVRIRVTALLPRILPWLDRLLQTMPEELPPFPLCGTLQDKGDFLLGCYWLLAQARLNNHDFSQCFLETGYDLPEAHLERAVLRFAARSLAGAQKRFPLWPWPEAGDPFRE